MTDTNLVLVERVGCTAVLTLNQPTRLNAVNLAMRTALFENLVELGGDDTCRAIVLTGSGGNFTAGGDISEMKPRPILEGRARVELSTRIFRAIVTSPKPVIAAIEGKAFGCGVSFAAASDYAVASRNARFSCAFIKVGLMADFGAIWSLAQRVGSRKAMELCAFAEAFDASKARDLELVNSVVEPGDALAAALEAAEKFAANPAIAMGLLKGALNSGSSTIEQSIATELDYISLLMNTEDFSEATAAFLEKRQPNFVGR